LRDIFVFRGHRSSLLRFPEEAIEPVLHQLQALLFNSINAHAPFLLGAQQPPLVRAPADDASSFATHERSFRRSHRRSSFRKRMVLTTLPRESARIRRRSAVWL